MSNEDKPGQGQHKSIRKRLTGTVLVPSIALLVMWTGVSAYFVTDAIYVRAVASSVQDVSIPAATALSAVQHERQLSLVYLENSNTRIGELQQTQQEIDGYLEDLTEVIESTKESAPGQIGAKLTELEEGLGELPVVRAEIRLRTIPTAEVNAFYNSLIDTASSLFAQQARIVPDVEATQGAIGATQVFRAVDKMSRAASLASSAFTSGHFTAEEHRLFSQFVGSYRSSLEEQASYLRPGAAREYERVSSSAQWQRLHDAENALIGQGPGPLDPSAEGMIGESRWRKLTQQIATELTDTTVRQADAVSSQALADANSNLRNVILGSAAALLAAIASIIVAVRVSWTLVDRTLMTRLERLRNDSLELAQSRLPNIVNRLKEGESTDVHAEVPRLDHGRDEIGQVADAFNSAQLTAVNAAVSEAKARNGVNNVFLGIAHRNQGLVHRQLQILDKMESREENTEQLKGLFQLDNLATRARRTTENLIILGGKQPGRRWRKPVELMDVLRAAVSETEDFSRIEVDRVPDVSISGSAVADSIHLVAELADNAASFSPPGSPVHITSTMVARGVVVDVADQGLGMHEEVREWANQMMSEPPEFDAMALKADSSLGLFVVARLAARLEVKVTFDSSRYGGTRATVLLPTKILASDEADDSDGAPQAQPPHASGNKANGRDEGTGGTPQPAPQHASDRTPAEPTEAGTVMSHEKNVLGDDRPSPNTVMPRTPAAPRTPSAPTSPRGPGGTDQSDTPQSPATASKPRPDVPNKRVDPDDRPRPARRRAPLPQRQPQESLADQLRDDPDSDTINVESFSGRTRSTLSAFHKGTRRGRGSDASGDESSND